MAIGRAEGELSHTPWFILRRLQNLGACSDGSSEESVDVIDLEIRDVAVIAEVAGGRYIWAAPEHELHLATTTEAPVTGINVLRIAPEDLAVPRGGPVEVMNREDGMRADDRHAGILPPDRCAA